MALFSLAARAGIPAARSAMRFQSKLKKPPETGITVYRGEPWDASPKLMKEVRNWMYGPLELNDGQSRASPLKYAAAGRWFTEQPGVRFKISGYTGFGNLGRIKKVTLSPIELKLARQLSTILHQREGRPHTTLQW